MRYLTTADGVRYTVEHDRLVELVGDVGADALVSQFSPKGGTTLVRIYDENDNVIAMGDAECSERDNFNAKRGHRIALGRALCELSGEASKRRQRRIEAAAITDVVAVH